jgi:uncharacterized membrane protein
MQNRLCTYCGFSAEPGAEFCVACGRELKQPVEVNAESTSFKEEPLYSIQPFTDVGSVLGSTIKIFTKNFWLISKLVFVIFAPLEIVKALSVDQADTTWQTTIGAMILWLICNALIAPSLIYALVTQMRTGVAPSLHESYRWGLSRLVPYSVCIILAWILQMLGYVLLIIPGIILAMAFVPVYPMAALESGSPVEILKRSYNLTKGHRWNIFAASLVLGLLCGLASLPITAISAVLILNGSRIWPLEAAVGVLGDIINEATTVLCLVIYLSILASKGLDNTPDSSTVNER